MKTQRLPGSCQNREGATNEHGKNRMGLRTANVAAGKICLRKNYPSRILRMIGPLFHVPDSHKLSPGNRRDRESEMSFRFGKQRRGRQKKKLRFPAKLGLPKPRNGELSILLPKRFTVPRWHRRFSFAQLRMDEGALELARSAADAGALTS
jgi:hypothetical protein